MEAKGWGAGFFFGYAGAGVPQEAFLVLSRLRRCESFSSAFDGGVLVALLQAS